MIFYAAPAALGDGDGSSAANAADFQDMSSGGFWLGRVANSLATEAVTVILLAGTYRGNVVFSGFGNSEHRMTLRGVSRDEVLFNIDDPDSLSEVFKWSKCQNWTVRDFSITGNGALGYVFRIYNESLNFWVENIRWFDIPNVIYGACGAHDSRKVIFNLCSFERIGTNSGAHMMYHANNGEDIRILSCHFKDCSGDYVRFRNHVDRGVVSNCSFVDTGTYQPGGNAAVSRPFIAMPLFNDCEPGSANCPDPNQSNQYEYFATQYIFSHNSFVYPGTVTAGDAVCIRFLHKGWDPPGKNHLLTAAEGAVLTGNNSAAKKALLLSNLGIDMDTIKVYGNSYQNEDSRFQLTSGPAYGAPNLGWNSSADIFDLVNSVAPTPGQSAKYQRRLLTLNKI